MDRKSESNAVMCGRCGERRPLVNVTTGGTRIQICELCLRDSLGMRKPSHGAQAALVLKALLQPRDSAALTTLPPPGTDSTCPCCGLTYKEFSADGRAGCAECYTAFAPAIRHALAVLHGTG